MFLTNFHGISISCFRSAVQPRIKQRVHVSQRFIASVAINKHIIELLMLYLFLFPSKENQPHSPTLLRLPMVLTDGKCFIPFFVARGNAHMIDKWKGPFMTFD